MISLGKNCIADARRGNPDEGWAEILEYVLRTGLQMVTIQLHPADKVFNIN